MKLLATLDDRTRDALAHHWPFFARPNQLLPAGKWTYWVLLAGRGFGKTRTGAETVREWVKTSDMVNLIGATASDARDIMIEGESGIMSICPDDERPTYRKSESKLIWPNGATSLIFSADEPERLRGKQHKKLWADELAAWRYNEAWDQAKFGLRLGDRPQAIATTTPKPTKLVRELLTDKGTVVTRGTSYENRDHLSPAFFDEIIKKYEGTRLGRQELRAEILTDTPGALWTYENIQHLPRHSIPLLSRIVVAIDPPAKSTEGSDECGIIAVGMDDKSHGYVLADASGVMSPEKWAATAIQLYKQLEADTIVAEVNQGGEMVATVIHSSEQPNARNIPVKSVHATRGKYIRAEPISALYERRLVYHCELFEALEDQMTSFTQDFDRTKNGSPDRMDALVWGLTELFPQMVAPVIAPKRREIVVR